MSSEHEPDKAVVILAPQEPDKVSNRAERSFAPPPPPPPPKEQK